MINNKNWERKSEDSELNIQKLLARNVCKITEDGRVLWNEAILLKFFEKSGIRKIDKFGDHKAFAARRGEKWEIIRTDHIWLHLLAFLEFTADLGDVSDYLYHNCIYFPPNVIKAIKEEPYWDVISFEDDEFDFTDDDCSLSEAPPPPLREAPPISPREHLA